MAAVEELREELDRIDGIVARAAASGDERRFLRLSMRKAALPLLIAEARARPIREQAERLEQELRDLDEELERARREEPEMPGHLRGTVTPEQYREQLLGTIASRQSELARRLRETRRKLREIEAG